MNEAPTNALAALSHLLEVDLERKTRQQEEIAKAALREHPDNWKLFMSVKDWAEALADVCRSHAASCAEVHADCNHPDGAAMNTLLAALCDHLGLPSDPGDDHLCVFVEAWPEENSFRDFVLRVSGAPIELIDGELVTIPTLPRWEPKSRFARKLAGLPTQPNNDPYLSIEETKAHLRGLEESFRNALWESLQTASVKSCSIARNDRRRPVATSPNRQRNC